MSRFDKTLWDLTPVVFLLLFVYVFGGTLGAGLGVAAGGRDTYVAYVVPGS